MLSAVLIFLALGVAMVYFTIAAVVVPRIALPGASDRFAQLFALGAISFFVGCGLTHVHIAIHAISEPRTASWHELGFHVFQFVGGAFFIWAALRFLEIRVEVKKTEEEHRLDELEELVLRDSLTGAYNRRYFDEELGRAVARYRRDAEPFAVAHIDIDDFKSINDRYGHGVGDQVLQRLVTKVAEQIRPTDSLVRFGGDEFGLMLPGANAATALRIAERVRTAAQTLSNDENGPVSVSLGLAACPEHATSPEDLVDLSDEALYRSKRMGKDQSSIAATKRLEPSG